jgi:hypothetical protein
MLAAVEYTLPVEGTHTLAGPVITGVGSGFTFTVVPDEAVHPCESSTITE